MLKPLHNRILVERQTAEARTASGIIIPDTAKEKPQMGKVVAVGSGVVDKQGKVQPLEVKTGDTILFGKYTGNEVTLEGKDYIIMREDDVLAVFG